MKELIRRISNADFRKANSIIRNISGIVDYFSSEEEKLSFITDHGECVSVVCDERVAYGDWQTPASLARKICEDHASKFGNPDVLIEPTCGLGAFVLSAIELFPDLSEIYALEINPQYVAELKFNILSYALCRPERKVWPDIHIYNDDFFKFGFSSIIDSCKTKNRNLAIIGNPPWVTNSRQGKNNSDNVPIKSNNYGLRGIDAITGKSNFDISEYITLNLLRLSQVNKGGISFLLKNSVIRNIITKQNTEHIHIGNVEQIMIDAASEFNVSVDASCFSAKFDCIPSLTCRVRNFYTGSILHEFGWVDNSFVSDIGMYENWSKYDGASDYVWRSGIKHDCSAVLELTLSDGVYYNGLGEQVHVEEDLIFPLLKSSDIKDYTDGKFRKYLIVPQHTAGQDTSFLKSTHPLAYAYLSGHKSTFSGRKSSIYKGKGEFSIFGVGEYSFKPYKIVVSSLYKDISFMLVVQFEGKPVMVDDTCYQLDFESFEEAKIVYNALQSHEIQSLLKSLIFMDAKRVITKGLLMRLDLAAVCRDKGWTADNKCQKKQPPRQLSIFDF